MCGIAGGPRQLTGGRLAAALEQLVPRGPDSQGRIAFGDLEVGIRRLAITDPRADQPIVRGGSKRLAIVFNGNLSRADALRTELEHHGLRPATSNDAELALLLYAALGVEGLRRLDGQFAFAIVDETARSLVLVRDRFGEKPLFVSQSRDEFGRPCFASTPAALRVLMGRNEWCESAPSRRDARQFARVGFFDATTSCFELPARAVSPGTIEVHGPRPASSKLAIEARAPHGESFSASIGAVVRDRARSDRGLGVFLSGGLDSALIASEIANAGIDALCMTLDFNEGRAEGGKAERIATRLGLSHERVPVGCEALDALPRLVAHYGLPLGDPSILAVHALSLHASKSHDIAVVLGGDGADELFHGYRRMRAWPWISRVRSCMSPTLRHRIGRANGAGERSRARRAIGSGRYSELWSLASEDTLDRLFGNDHAAAASEGTPRDATEVRDLERLRYLVDDLLVKTDIGGLAAGVEIRAPYLDQRIVRHAEELRTHTAARGKLPIRKLLSERLPRDLVRGRKLGFAPPIARWLVARTDLVTSLLEQGDSYFDVREALRIRDENLRGRHEHAQFLFCLTSLGAHAEARGRFVRGLEPCTSSAS
ncbi:MAG: asparagine synthetase B [Planctomycetes bacterium]|nr:asparagine synthetase B [Planctomycetota bacterium]